MSENEELNATETPGTGDTPATPPAAPEYTSPINAALEAVITAMNATNPFATVTRGALPSGPGLTCELGPNNPEEIYFDKDRAVTLDVTLNGKHANLKTVTDAMNLIHARLTRATSYTSGTGWQIIDIRNYSLPNVIGREENNMWLLASSLAVDLFWRGE